MKIADTFFSDEKLNQLSVITPNATLCIIKDYEVVEKREVRMPDELIGIVKCDNHKCITNNEPMKTRFHVVDSQNGTLCCHYCERLVTKDEIVLK